MSASGLGVSVRGVSVRFGATEALARAGVEIAPGEFMAIVGDSGGGKTTLLRAIGGLLPVASGAIAFVDGTGAAVRPGPRDVGFCFQEGRLLPWRSVLANVALPLELEGVPRAERLHAAAEMLDRMRLSGVERRMPGQLSGGMRMRVAMARALVTRPRLLLLDEPFGALDEVTRQALDEELLVLVRETGATAVLVTHSIQEAVALADRVLVLRGRPGVSLAPIAIDLPARDEAARLSVGFASLCAQVQAGLRGGRVA
ncbi:MAG: ABC transporter ATP-binding protein [Planctomycetota bacterium]